MKIYVDFEVLQGGIVSVNKAHVSTVFQTPEGGIAIVMDNSIGYQLAGKPALQSVIDLLTE